MPPPPPAVASLEDAKAEGKTLKTLREQLAAHREQKSCAACHAQVHRLLSIWKWIPALLVELWAEQHPGIPVQLQIQLSAQLELNFGGRELSAAKLVLPGGQVG